MYSSSLGVLSKGTQMVNINLKLSKVAKEFEENLHNFLKTHQHVIKIHLELTLAIIATNTWELRAIDLKTAFLQGNKLIRDIYLKPPVEANCEINFVWKLKKCVYELSDTSLKWYH